MVTKTTKDAKWAVKKQLQVFVCPTCHNTVDNCQLLKFDSKTNTVYYFCQDCGTKVMKKLETIG